MLEDNTRNYLDRVRPMVSQGGSRSCRSEEPMNQLPSNRKRFANFEEDPFNDNSKRESNWHHLDDMVKGILLVNSLTELWDAFLWFKQCGFVEILEIKDKLTSESKHIMVLFNFDNRMIGEMQFRYEPLAPQYNSYLILDSLQRATNPIEFMSIILNMAKTLADNDKLIWDNVDVNA